MKFFAFLISVFAIIYLVHECDGKKVSYKGSQVWRVDIEGLDQFAIKYLRVLVDTLNLDVWTETRTHLDIRVDPIHQLGLRESLSVGEIKHSVLIEDVEEILMRDMDLMSARESREFSISKFNTFEDIETFLSGVDASNPNASLRSIGKTLEGRDLWLLKFSVSPGKPSVWIDCGIHAREWITQSTCLWGIQYISDNYGTDPDITMLLDSYDLHILAVVNPDGYSYTWTDDRLWRKNRNLDEASGCYGIDLNRNFDDGYWGGVGSSADPCSITYHGSGPASELEIQAIQTAMTDLSDNENLRIVYSIHSYSQYWMYPHAYTSDPAPDVVELDRIAQKGVEALTSVYGTPYTYGPWYTVLYPSTGTTLDFAYNTLSMPQSFTIELRPNNQLGGGFQISEEEILPTAIETWTGIIAAILDK